MFTPEKPGESTARTSVPAQKREPGLSADENVLLTTGLPYALTAAETARAWSRNQAVIARLLIRIGRESRMLDSIARVALVGSLEGVHTRIALIPMMGRSARHALEQHGLGELVYRLAGECMLMELSAAAGYRTFCFPELVKGLLKTGKMKNSPVERMMDTFEFLSTMVQHPLNDQRVLRQFERTNGLHARYKVAGAGARNLFKYIALNMFYIGPSMRSDLTPEERHAICGLTVLVAERMGHTIDGSVKDLECFIRDYEAAHMFDRDDQGIIRRRAVEIAQASKNALDKIPTISPARVHGYVPHRVKKILEIE